MFHAHKFKEQQRVYVPPVSRKIEVGRASEDMMHTIMFGVTSIMFKCEICGKVKESRLLGDHRKA